MRWLLDTPQVSGLFNVGTGEARSFRDLVDCAVRMRWDARPDIDYIDMPEDLRARYQYFTQASVRRLRDAGFDRDFVPLEWAVADYVTRFLAAPGSLPLGKVAMVFAT